MFIKSSVNTTAHINALSTIEGSDVLTCSHLPDHCSSIVTDGKQRKTTAIGGTTIHNLNNYTNKYIVIEVIELVTKKLTGGSMVGPVSREY